MKDLKDKFAFKYAGGEDYDFFTRILFTPRDKAFGLYNEHFCFKRVYNKNRPSNYTLNGYDEVNLEWTMKHQASFLRQLYPGSVTPTTQMT